MKPDGALETVAVDLANGKKLWAHPATMAGRLPGMGVSAPALVETGQGPTIVALDPARKGRWNATLVARDARTGKQKWTRPDPFDVRPPALRAVRLPVGAHRARRAPAWSCSTRPPASSMWKLPGIAEVEWSDRDRVLLLRLAKQPDDRVVRPQDRQAPVAAAHRAGARPRHRHVGRLGLRRHRRRPHRLRRPVHQPEDEEGLHLRPVLRQDRRRHDQLDAPLGGARLPQRQPRLRPRRPPGRPAGRLRRLRPARLRDRPGRRPDHRRRRPRLRLVARLPQPHGQARLPQARPARAAPSTSPPASRCRSRTQRGWSFCVTDPKPLPLSGQAPGFYSIAAAVRVRPGRPASGSPTPAAPPSGSPAARTAGGCGATRRAACTPSTTAPATAPGMYG